MKKPTAASMQIGETWPFLSTALTEDTQGNLFLPADARPLDPQADAEVIRASPQCVLIRRDADGHMLILRPRNQGHLPAPFPSLPGTTTLSIRSHIRTTGARIDNPVKALREILVTSPDLDPAERLHLEAVIKWLQQPGAQAKLAAEATALVPSKTKNSSGLTRAGDLLSDLLPEPLGKDIVISKRHIKRAQQIELVRKAREEGKQDVGFSSRPFVLCGLPLRRLPKNDLLHIRKNGKFFLRVSGDPEFGVPFGQDRLIPMWVATLARQPKRFKPDPKREETRQKMAEALNIQPGRVILFDTAAEILDLFGLLKDGRTYKRLVEGFQRVFAATIFFGTEEQLKAAAVWDWTRFHFFDRARLWYDPKAGLEQAQLPANEFRNLIVLSEAFWKELQAHPIPIDLDIVRSLANSPGALDFYTWLVWRSFTAEEETSLPLFGPNGLTRQLGVSKEVQERQFRRRIRDWLTSTKKRWPECPADLSNDGQSLIVRPGQAITNPQYLVSP